MYTRWPWLAHYRLTTHAYRGYSVPSVRLSVDVVADLWRYARGRAADGVSFADVVAVLIYAARVLVPAAAELSTLSGAEKKALVDQAVIALLDQVLLPVLVLPWWLSVLFGGTIHEMIARAVPVITQGVYDSLKPQLAA